MSSFFRQDLELMSAFSLIALVEIEISLPWALNPVSPISWPVLSLSLWTERQRRRKWAWATAGVDLWTLSNIMRWRHLWKVHASKAVGMGASLTGFTWSHRVCSRGWDGEKIKPCDNSKGRVIRYAGRLLSLHSLDENPTISYKTYAMIPLNTTGTAV